MITNKKIHRILIILTVIAIDSNIQAMKKISQKIYYKTNPKYKEQRKVEHFYKKIEETSHTTNNLIDTLITNNFISKYNNIHDFSDKLIHFIHFFYKQYPAIINGKITPKIHRKCLDEIEQYISDADQFFATYIKKNQSHLCLSRKKQKKVSSLTKNLKHLKKEITTLNKAHRTMDNYLEEHDTTKYAPLFQKRLKTIKKILHTNKKEGEKKLYSQILLRTLHINIKRLRENLDTILYQCFCNNLLTKEEHLYIINGLGIVCDYIIPDMLSKLNYNIKHTKSLFIKNLLELIKYFYLFEENLFEKNYKKTLHSLQRLNQSAQEMHKQVGATEIVTIIQALYKTMAQFVRINSFSS